MPPSATATGLTAAAVTSSLANNGHTVSPIPSEAAAVHHPGPQLAELDASKLKITLNPDPKPFNPNASTEWGKQDVTTDHWITCKWSDTAGWGTPEMKPYGPIDLWPTASCLHYATECFEGLKAYRGYDGALRLFRPNCNTARMMLSSTRIALPSFPPNALEELIKVLIAHDAPKWLPSPGTFLYIRPTMIGTGRALGVQKPREAMLFIVAALFPILDANPMKLLASREDSIRAWPGGFGYAKVGANYGPSLMAHKEAQSHGYDQILWLFDKSCQVTEAGASNFFVLWRSKSSPDILELVTAPLDDKIILDGVTRRSVLELARGRLPGVQIVERKYTMHDLVEAYEEGRLLEAFAAGTAFFIASVTSIHFRGHDIILPEGEYTTTLKNWLKGIMYGKERHVWGVVVPEIKMEQLQPVDEDEVQDVLRKIQELRKDGGRAVEVALARMRCNEA